MSPTVYVIQGCELDPEQFKEVVDGGRPSCPHDNPVNAKFCNTCGVRISLLDRRVTYNIESLYDDIVCTYLVGPYEVFVIEEAPGMRYFIGNLLAQSSLYEPEAVELDIGDNEEGIKKALQATGVSAKSFGTFLLVSF